MFYTIYKITHIPSKMVYIGMHKTDDINDDYMGSGKRLRYAINKYGLDQFSKEILHVFDTEKDMVSKEAELVTEEFCAREDTYNICPRGKGGWGYVNSHNLQHSAESKRMRNESRSNNQGWLSKTKVNGAAMLRNIENREKAYAARKMSGPHLTTLGMKHSKEALEKMSKAHSGKNNSQYGSIWITDGNTTKKINKTSLIPSGWRKGRK